MIRFFAKLTRGHFRKHRLEALLCLIGVTLGVAVVISIDSAVGPMNFIPASLQARANLAFSERKP